jgi:hypothetical protein
LFSFDERKREDEKTGEGREKPSWHHDGGKKAGPEESDEMAQILKPAVKSRAHS